MITYTLNSPGDLTLISYSGGPSSNIGVGNTEIKFTTDNGGLRFIPCALADALPAAFNPPLGFLPAFLCQAGLYYYEEEDNTASSQTFACSADSCEVVDIGQS